MQQFKDDTAAPLHCPTQTLFFLVGYIYLAEDLSFILKNNMVSPCYFPAYRATRGCVAN